jgi:putative copper export protein
VVVNASFSNWRLAHDHRRGLAVHILGAVIWVGGMFAIYVCLRPALGRLDPGPAFTFRYSFGCRMRGWAHLDGN